MAQGEQWLAQKLISEREAEIIALAVQGCAGNAEFVIKLSKRITDVVQEFAQAEHKDVLVGVAIAATMTALRLHLGRVTDALAEIQQLEGMMLQ